MHSLVVNSLVLSVFCINVVLSVDHLNNGELAESGRGIIDVQKEGIGSVSYIIHPDNLPDPHFTPLQHLIWPDNASAKVRTDKLIDTSSAANFSNILTTKDSEKTSGYKEEKPSVELSAENHFTPIDPAVSARIEAVSLSLLKHEEEAVESRKPQLLPKYESSSFKSAAGLLKSSKNGVPIVNDTSSSIKSAGLTTFSSVSSEKNDKFRGSQEHKVVNGIFIALEEVSTTEKLVVHEELSIPEKLVAPEEVSTPERLIAPEELQTPEQMVPEEVSTTEGITPEAVTPAKLITPEAVTPEMFIASEDVSTPGNLTATEKIFTTEKLIKAQILKSLTDEKSKVQHEENQNALDEKDATNSTIGAFGNPVKKTGEHILLEKMPDIPGLENYTALLKYNNEDYETNTEESSEYYESSTEVIDEDIFERPILNNETEEVLQKLSHILQLDEKFNGSFLAENDSYSAATEMIDTYSDGSPMDVVTSFEENPAIQLSNHTPRYDDTSSSTFEDIKNFLTDLANSDGFNSAFLGDLIKNFGNLDHNALNLIYSLLIRPLTERSKNIRKTEFFLSKQDKFSDNYDDLTGPWNPSSMIRPDAAGDGLWKPIIRRPKSPVATHVDHGVEVITAPNSREFEVVLSSSFNSASKVYPNRHPVAQNRAGFAAIHPPPKNFVLGQEMPPPEALKALPPGAVLIPPNQVVHKPLLPRLPENASPKMGSGSLSDLLPNFPFFGGKKETPAMERESSSKLSSIPSFFSSLFGKSKPKPRLPPPRKIRIDRLPIVPPLPVFKPQYISSKEKNNVSSHANFHREKESHSENGPVRHDDSITSDSEDMDSSGSSASHTVVHSENSFDRSQPFSNGNINRYVAPPNTGTKKTNHEYVSSYTGYRLPHGNRHYITKVESPPYNETPYDETFYDSKYQDEDLIQDTSSDADIHYEDNIQSSSSQVRDHSETYQYILPLNYEENGAGDHHEIRSEHGPNNYEQTTDLEGNYEANDDNYYEDYSVDRDDKLSNRHYYDHYDDDNKEKTEIGIMNYEDRSKFPQNSDDYNQENISDKVEDYYEAPTSELQRNSDNESNQNHSYYPVTGMDLASHIEASEKDISSESHVTDGMKESRNKFNEALDRMKTDPETILYSNVGPVDIPEGTIIPKEDFEKALVERKYKNKFVRIDNIDNDVATPITSTQKSPLHNEKEPNNELSQGTISQNTIDGNPYPSLTREHDASVSHLWNNVKVTLHKEDPENADLNMLDENPFLKVPFPSVNFTEFEGMKTNRDERSLMAYILIGSCCGLALLSIVGIVVIVRFKKTCATRQIGGKVRRSHLSGRHDSLGNLSLPDGGDNKSGHKLGSWFTGRNEQFGSGKLRSNMTLPEVMKAGSTRDLLSLSSASSHTSSLMELSKEEGSIAKDTKNTKANDERTIPVSSSWLHGDLEVSMRDQQSRKSKSVRSKVKSQNFDSEEAVSSPMGAKSYHYYGESSREFGNSKHLGVASFDSDDMERATTGHSRYHSDSEFDETSYDNADSRELGMLAKNRAKQARSMDSEELGDEISRDLRNFQKDHEVSTKASDKFGRANNTASFSRDNIQNEVFLEFDKMLRQHTHSSTLGGGSATMKSNFSDSPPQSPTFDETANSEDVNHKAPYAPPKFNPPAPPPRPPKPSRFSPDSATHSPRGGRARAPTPKDKDTHEIDESSDDERLI